MKETKFNNGIYKEINELKKFILVSVYIFLAFFIFFFFFSFKKIDLYGISVFLPMPAFSSVSAQFFKKFQKDILGDKIQLIVTNPLSAFLGQALTSLMLAFISFFPFFIYKIIRYISPAFYRDEKKVLFKILIPSLILFIGGCIFAYFILIPPTFKILYSYAETIGAVQFINVNEFIIYVFGIMITSGILFLLPVMMATLNYLGVVDSSFWKDNWQYAVLFFLIFSAIITPDGSGITMLILSLPLSVLYFGGFIAGKKIQRSKPI